MAKFLLSVLVFMAVASSVSAQRSALNYQILTNGGQGKDWFNPNLGITARFLPASGSTPYSGDVIITMMGAKWKGKYWVVNEKISLTGLTPLSGGHEALPNTTLNVVAGGVSLADLNGNGFLGPTAVLYPVR